MSTNISDLLPSWFRALRAANRSDGTIKSYRLAADQLIEHAGDLPAEDYTSDMIAGFLAAVLETRAPATARQRYASLRQLFRWLAAEGEIPTDPMDRLKPPKVPEQPVPIVGEDELRRLLATCEGNDWVERRDRAILLTFIDTGIRLGEMAGLKVADVHLDLEVAVVTGKGNRTRTVPFGSTTALALDRWLRARRRIPRTDRLPALWVSHKGGALSASGINQMVKRRGADAGIEGLHAHQFRHTFAHEWLLAGGSEQDLQRIAGWQSPQMVKRYGASGADTRAREAHRYFGPADRL